MAVTNKMFSSRTIAFTLAFLFVVIACVPVGVRADEWRLPKKEKYFSPNKKYHLEVTPKKLESQLKYFEDKVDNKKSAGAVHGLKENWAKGAFFARSSDGSYSRKSQFLLVNEVSPVSAIVSNDGKYFVTFDNWHSMGYGDDVVVIYRSDGSVIKKFSLEDLLTEGDIETLPHSVSSIEWGGDHYINDSDGLLVLKIVSNGKAPWESGAQFHELKIEMATGRALEPKRDLFPQPRVFTRVEAAITNDSDEVSPDKPVCPTTNDTFDAAGASRVSSEQLVANVRERPLPPYPPIAKAAHAEGTIIVEVIISTTGDVVCARSLTGNPLLRAAATSSLLKWKFEPFEVAGQRGKVVGTIAINFKFPDKDKNPTSSRN